MSNAQESIIRDLEQRQAEVQAGIQNAVRAGTGSMALRGELKTVQQQLQDARNDHAVMAAHGRQIVARASVEVGDALTGAALDRIASASAPFGAFLAAGVPAIDFSGSAAVESALQNVAASRARVAEAEAAHSNAMAAVAELAGKAATKRDRHAELSGQRVTGEAGEGSAAEMYAIAEDVKTLDGMHATAKSKADSLTQPMHDARNSLNGAEKQAATVEYRLQAGHLVAHAKALDAALIDCLRAAQAAGAKAGVGIGALFQASLDLRTFISTGAIPQPFRR